MNTIIDVTVECGTQEEIDLISRIIKTTLPDNPVLVHDENVVVKALNPPPNESLLTKYWAAKEIARDIWETEFYDKLGIWHIVHKEHLNNLRQLLKKEWCR